MPDLWESVLTRAATRTAPNRYALERAARVARLVAAIAAATPEKQRPRRVDLARLAAIFASVPYASAAPGAVPTPQQHDEAAERAVGDLKDLLPAADIEVVIRILAQSRARAPQLAEARLLSDAVALEDIGLVGLWNQTRAFHASGKTLEQLLRLWKAQEDYGYWQPRLAEGLFFDATRAAARRRLDALHTIFDRLSREHDGRDV